MSDLPAWPTHELRMRITAQPSDIDELEHVSNIAYVRWIQDVAAAHSAAVGLRFSDYRRIGGVFVVRRHEIEYLTPALLGDELELVTWVAGFRGAATDRRTRVVRARDGVELVRATTKWAYVSLGSGRPVRIPAEVIAAFRSAPRVTS